MSYTAWNGAAPVWAASMTSEFDPNENSCGRRVAAVADVDAAGARRLNVRVAWPAAAGVVAAGPPGLCGSVPPPPEHAASATSAAAARARVSWRDMLVVLSIDGEAGSCDRDVERRLALRVVADDDRARARRLRSDRERVVRTDGAHVGDVGRLRVRARRRGERAGIVGAAHGDGLREVGAGAQEAERRR